jgi:hypothetical protein
MRDWCIASSIAIGTNRPLFARWLKSAGTELLADVDLIVPYLFTGCAVSTRRR